MSCKWQRQSARRAQPRSTPRCWRCSGSAVSQRSPTKSGTSPAAKRRARRQRALPRRPRDSARCCRASHARTQSLSGASEFDPQPVDAAVLVRDVSERIEATLGAKAAARIMADAPPLQLLCDRRLAAEALTELLGNALVHSPEGQRVHFAAVDAPPDRVRFEIVDHGPGVPEHVLDREFGLLAAADRLGETLHLGLGLALARAIANRHGGHLGIMSEPGIGTEAFLSFSSAEAQHSKESLKRIRQMSRNDLQEWGHTPVS